MYTRRTNDLETIYILDKQCFPIDEHDVVHDTRNEWWIVSDNGVPVAYAGAYYWKMENAYVLSRCGVTSPYRGRGLQVHLLKKRISRAKELGCDWIWTYTSSNGVASNNNLIKAGFTLWMPKHWAGSDTPWKPTEHNGWLYWRLKCN